MGWYSQGTQVVDFVELPNGADRAEAGRLVPPDEREHVGVGVFKYQANPNGTFTYWGATGDFNLGSGRSAIDVWKVTLPAPPLPAGG